MFNYLFRFVVIFILLFSSLAYSQSVTIKGQVTDSETNLPLPNCNIILKPLDIGTATDANGFYQINNLPKGEYIFSVSFIGFNTIAKKITLTKNKILNFSLAPKNILLNETIVKSNRAVIRKTPVAFSEKDNKIIKQELGSQDVPHILQSTPSVYVSSQGGGTGDLRINFRGFDQTHLAVMINGIPINNPENGEIYWSNWSGIGDIVDKIQVQRGLTTNPYSLSAIGGLLNIKTIGVHSNSTNFIKLRTETGSDNLRKFSIAINNHIVPNKISFTGFLSKKNWDGYAAQTQLQEYTYYFAVGGIFNNHSLEFKAIDSPQKHGQRMTMQNISTWNLRGKRYNADWGYFQGKPLNTRDNKYYNPTLSLNHNWQVANNIIISNLIYFIYGKGGGTVPPYTNFELTENGQINFEKEYNNNSNNIDSTHSTTLNKTENALRYFNHTHNWFGFLSTLKYSAQQSTLTFGIDYRYYKANNHQEVSNLLGGDYTIGFAGKNNNYALPLFLGDKIDFDADSFAKHLGSFIQYEFNNNLLSFYFNSTISNTSYNRIDYFNYLNNDPERETGWKYFWGYSFKSGINYNLNKTNNIYFNAGIISKPPIVYNVFDYNNKIFPNVTNENIFSLELGYGLITNKIELSINSFYTIWKNKAFNKTQQDWATGQFFFYNITGADSKHLGIEIESKYSFTKDLQINGMLSISENKFTSNAITAKSPEDKPTQIHYSTSYIKGTFLPRFPMTTFSLSLLYNKKIYSKFNMFIKPEINYFVNQYAQFDPTARENQNETGINSWKLPAAYISNLHLGLNYSFHNSFIQNIDLTFHLFNIFSNTNFIIDAIDGQSHSQNDALVWYGRERWWNVSLAVTF